jgi:hypothetical protein
MTKMPLADEVVEIGRSRIPVALSRQMKRCPTHYRDHESFIIAAFSSHQLR